MGTVDLIPIARRRERFEALALELKKRYGVQVDPLVADFGKDVNLKRVLMFSRSIGGLAERKLN